MNCIILYWIVFFGTVTVHVTKVLPPSPSQAGVGVVLKSLKWKMLCWAAAVRRQWAALKSLFIIHNSKLQRHICSGVPALNIKQQIRGHVCTAVCWGRVKGVLFAPTTPTEYKDGDREAGGHIFPLPFHNGETWTSMPPWMLKGRHRCPLKHTAKVVYWPCQVCLRDLVSLYSLFCGHYTKRRHTGRHIQSSLYCWPYHICIL